MPVPVQVLHCPRNQFAVSAGEDRAPDGSSGYCPRDREEDRPGEYLAEQPSTRGGGVTLAPETGSDALRSAIGKEIGNDKILEDVHSLISCGIRDLKLYFMVGLPGEDLSDIDAIIDLTKRIRQSFIHVSKGNKRLGELSVSINTMVPKPHTAYERSEMLNIADAKVRIKKIIKVLKKESNIAVSFEGPKWAYLQGMLSRGDRTVLDVIIEMAKKEANEWQEVLRQWPRNPDYYALRQRSAGEILPWSFYSVCTAGPRSIDG